jgi:hypothetical protein
MSRKRWLLALGSATLALGVVLLFLDVRMMDTGGPGIIGFELAGTEDRAAEILGDWGDRGADAARASLWIDYAYIVAYTLFLVLAARATRDLAESRGWSRMAAFGAVVPVLAVGTGAFDTIEDIWLLLALDQNGGALAPRLGQICAIVKFALAAVTIGYLLAGLGLRLRSPSAGDRSASPGWDR